MKLRWMLLSVSVWVLLALACNAPLEPVTVPPAPTLADPPDNNDNNNNDTDTDADNDANDPQGAPVATLAVDDDDDNADDSSDEPLPTFTPIRQEPTIAATLTLAPATATATKPAGVAPTATAASSGPLEFSYTLSWEVDPNDIGRAIATVTINATGGSGEYSYFRDQQPVDGPTFTYEWATCRSNPGSFTVTSSDGQSISIDYFEVPPCPEQP